MSNFEITLKKIGIVINCVIAAVAIGVMIGCILTGLRLGEVIAYEWWIFIFILGVWIEFNVVNKFKELAEAMKKEDQK